MDRQRQKQTKTLRHREREKKRKRDSVRIWNVYRQIDVINVTAHIVSNRDLRIET